MILGLSTRWNAGRHVAGESMLEEILELGFTHLELGYDLTLDLVPGVRRLVDQGQVQVDSVHCFCPAPLLAPRPSPELFCLADLDPRARQNALMHTRRTIQFAAEVGARFVVTHLGNVAMRHRTSRLFDLLLRGKRDTPRYERARTRLLLERDQKAGRHLPHVYSGLEQVLPALEEHDVTLGVEIVPSWEGIPTELEMEDLLRRFDTPRITYWHDFGHAQVRENLDLSAHRHWLQRFRPRLSGMHIHDVAPPACDHLMPPHGEIDFGPFRDDALAARVLTLEPAPATEAADVREGATRIRAAWGMD